VYFYPNASKNMVDYNDIQKQFYQDKEVFEIIIEKPSKENHIKN
jgi:hypothetical protein